MCPIVCVCACKSCVCVKEREGGGERGKMQDVSNCVCVSPLVCE